MTRLYCAFSMSGMAANTLVSLAAQAKRMPLLVALPYLPAYETWSRRHPEAAAFHQPLMLDSGAFSVWKSGRTIDIDALVAVSREPRWCEAVALDVINDPAGSLANARYMQAHGSPAYPVFHFGEPWDILTAYVAEFPKVGLSCRFGEPERDSLKWLEQCFARAWPYRFHSFGWVKGAMLKRFPFESADASSWQAQPAMWGRWGKLGNLRLRGYLDATVVVDELRELQRQLAHQWAPTLASLGGYADA